MPKFTTEIREVHVSHREIVCDDEETAREYFEAGEGEETYLEYSHVVEDDDPLVIVEVDDD